MKNTTALAVHPEYKMYQKNNTAYCSSLQVAEAFGKRHDHVLRDIQNLNCSEDFLRYNFIRTTYINSQNKKQPMYLMTEEGFTHLAMSYRGKKAAITREEIINNGFHSKIN